ncbi:MAG: hypothetical protein A2X61_14980 [Ignavibacteria bacterium GWB2_35_12]|nr:MAG: hypothetical protein A2X61_14980 [Ignavibacteria bacterium GWB2_35_12]OGU91095.1 MAG: hypothetical protein A2220_17245 [Ignavibacteria bacterium RIFOXYA2_FULL_35_10]OGV22473.1 MAG: hypothetical protein A2475_10100 [Ignavibacteria bacterium RIFOXYC2_FULL_35_21]
MAKQFLLIIISFILLVGCGESKQDYTFENKELIEDTLTADEVLKDTSIGQLKDDSFLTIPKQERDKKYYKGRVVYLSNIFIGNYAPMEKELMKLLASKGQPIVFMTGEGVNGIIYFVLNADNQPAVRMLAEYSDSKKVSIYGKMVRLNDLRILVADKIERVK